MMMNVTFDQLLEFVNKALVDELKVIPAFYADGIIIYKDDNNIFIELHNTYVITVRTKLGNFDINITEQEVNKYRVLMDIVKEYSTNKSITFFNNFFAEDNNKSTTKDINDLNDED